MKPTHALCVHGHFYQPPREDPLTGLIPQELGAAPFGNWNERIHAECYAPNAALGNFERMSFNLGPTLLSWMEEHDPGTYRAILAQDQANVRRHGVGNAMAQAYNHTILPLATARDKVTQIRWGIVDFEQRFGRRPQGMWLPETAVDSETLAIMARHGIEFTILAPWQAVPEIDTPLEPHRVSLPDGLAITVFFYERGLSTAVSFDPEATLNADLFVEERVLPLFDQKKTAQGAPQLLTIASDGELYGHHQPGRERFLDYLLRVAGPEAGLTLTYPALWLREHPATRPATIREQSSWSCHHGVSRWQEHCDCSEGKPSWKAQLRGGLRELASAIDAAYERALRSLVPDPWELRNRSISVQLGQQSLGDLVGELAGRRPPEDELRRAELLLASQWERQRMFTSCGWFFEDLSRIEPRNNIIYAAQAVRLLHAATGVDLAPQALALLRQARSWRMRLRADQVFERAQRKAAKLGR